MQRKESPIFPSARELYEKILDEKIYRLITIYDPKTLKSKLASKEIQECLKEEPKEKQFSENYWEYYFTIVSNHKKVHEALDEYKFEIFKENKFIPLENFKYDYLGYTFSSKPIESPLLQLPLSYRAEALYKLILRTLIDEARYLEKFNGMFGGRLIFNFDIGIYKEKEWVSCFNSEVVREFIPGDYYQINRQILVENSSSNPDVCYNLTDFKFNFIELAIPYHNNENYCLLEKDKAQITPGVRSIFSQIQYNYLLELKKIGSLENILCPAHSIFDPLTPHQRNYIDAKEQQITSVCNDPDAATYQVIMNDLENTIKMLPSQFVLTQPNKIGSIDYKSFTKEQMDNLDVFSKIKLSWEEVGNCLIIRPVLSDISKEKFIPVAIYYFPRNFAIKVQNVLLNIIKDGSTSSDLLVNRLAPPGSGHYSIRIEKEGLVRFKCYREAKKLVKQNQVFSRFFLNDNLPKDLVNYIGLFSNQLTTNAIKGAIKMLADKQANEKEKEIDASSLNATHVIQSRMS